jgi:glyoxylase-like metal-dependent hydrolase (beta-lactamase superfamily II)
MFLTMKKILSVFVFALFSLSACSSQSSKLTPDIRLYVLNCGDISMDMSGFSRNGEFAGEHGELANPCFLIRHPKGDLLWDTGFEESLVDTPEGVSIPGFQKRMKTRLTTQLAELGLAPSDIDYVALSHSHPDHAGNANHFAQSKFLLEEREYEFMFSDERREDVGQFQYFSEVEAFDVLQFKDSHDVFSDGSVQIYWTPGHTPGHAVLLVRLKNAGPILLSGDLYIQSKGRELRAIPTFNTDEQSTLASMDKFEALAHAEGAKIIIQHDKDSVVALPKFPAYLN